MTEKTTESSGHIAATPEAVYALVADLPQQGRFTQECERVQWLGGGSEAVVGARFRGHNRKGSARWSTVGEITEAEPGKALAYRVRAPFGVPVADWRYDITPDGEGCQVDESTVDHRPRWLAMLTSISGLSPADRSGINRKNMAGTLAALKALAESN